MNRNRDLAGWLALSVDERAARRTLALQDATDTAASHGVYISITRLDDDSPRAGLLSGIPFAVKDNIDVAGVPTTGGTPVFTAATPIVDSGAVSALREEGAVVIGKTNLHELAFGVTSNNGHFGPVRNPNDTSRSAGGSSGGSAATVALGTVPFSLGTDTGGSITIPASFCGVVGFRPTIGRYPGDGLINLSHSRDTVGIHANSVDDARTIDGLITRAAPYGERFSADWLRLGVPKRYFQDLDDEVAEIASNVLDQLRELGADLVDIDVPEIVELTGLHAFELVFFETAQTLVARGSHLGEGFAGLDLRSFADGSGSPDVQAILGMLAESPIAPERYEQARFARMTVRRAYQKAFASNGLDAFIFPSVPVLPPLLGNDDTVDFKGAELPLFPTITRNAGPGTFAGVPMVSLPAGTTSTGLPVGMTVEGPFHQDAHLLSVAECLESVLQPTM